MGQEFITWIKEKVSKEQKTAFAVTFLCVLFIHLYKFTNTLPNHDSLENYYSDQNILGSGRWALSVACGISSYFDLPWVIGLLSCIYIALTAAVIITLLKVKNPVLIALCGGLLAAAPATTETFFFQFTADGYMLSMLLAALAVYWSRMEENKISRLILSGICVCVCCGIYQAYVSFALVLALCYFIQELFIGRFERKTCFQWVRRQLIIYSVALVAYYIIWKLCMRFCGITASDYQGISEVGKISLNLLLHGAVSAVRSFLMYFLQFNVLEHGFTLYSVLSILFLVAFMIGIAIAMKASGILRRKWAVGLLLLCLVAVIPFSCIWHFTSESVGYRAMMLQSITLLFMLAALLFETWAKPIQKNAVGVLLSAIIINNALMANISYFYMNLCYERSYADGVEMMCQIHDLQDEYDFQKIAVIGTRIYEVQYDNIDQETGKVNTEGKINILIGGLEKNLLYDSEHTVRFLTATFGLECESVTSQEREEIAKTDWFAAMECWPAEESMAVVDDVLIVKLSDLLP